MRELLNHIGWLQEKSTKLYVDNTSAILLMNRQSSNTSSRRKHIRVKYHYIQEQIKENIIQPEWIPTDQQEADIMTKALTRSTFERLRDQITGHLIRTSDEKSSKTSSLSTPSFTS